jgi:hypothetical protein
MAMLLDFIVLNYFPHIKTDERHQQKYRYYVYDQQKLLCWTDFSAGIGQPQMLDRFFCWYWTKANVIFEANFKMRDLCIEMPQSLCIKGNSQQFHIVWIDKR